MKIRRYWQFVLLSFSIVGLFNFCNLKEPLLTPTNDTLADFDADKYDAIAPAKIQFTDKSKGTGTLTYAWNFGDNIGTSVDKNPSYTYTRAGVYKVALTTSGTNGKHTAEKTITITVLGSKPLAQFTYTVTNGGRAPCAVTLTNTSLNATRYSWSFGDGSSLDTNRTPQPHTYTTVGKFPLLLSALNSAGDKHDTTVMVTIKPTACFSVACNICLAPSALASFDGSCSVNADAYSWNFGDPTSSNNTAMIQRPTHVFNTEGFFNVTLVVTKNSISDTAATQTVVVKSFTKDTSFATLGPAKKVLTLGDGYMVVGNTTTGSNTNIYLLKVDLNLNIVGGYPKMLTTTGTNVADGFIQLADGSFAIVGTAFNTVNNTDDILYRRTNSAGTLIDAPPLFGVGGYTANDKARNIIETPDGNILIVGSTYNNTTATYDAFVMKKSTNLSTNYFDKRLDGANDEVAFSAALLSNNAGFLITGTTAATSSGKTDVLFMKIDINGGISVQKSFGTANFYETATAMVKNTAGNFMTCGASNAVGFNNVHLMQVDASLNALTNFPSTVSSTTSETAKDLKEIPTGGYIIAGEHNLDAFNGIVNAQGVAIGNINVFGANGRDYFESVALTNDGGFIFAGSKNGVLYLVKTNKNGAL